VNRRLVALPVLGAAAALAVTGIAGAGQGDQHRDPKFAVLAGGYEVSPVDGKAGTGDPDGRGSATVMIHGTRTLCYGLTVSGITKPVAAHIHKGGPGMNGPVVIPLVEPGRGNPGAEGRCLRGLNARLLADIQARPHGYYVNVHTEQFPAGAVRGQLH
jgi:hypothetical protein